MFKDQCQRVGATVLIREQNESERRRTKITAEKNKRNEE